MKDAIAITLITLGIICGACTGIVGGAGTIALVADIVHIAVGS